MTGAVLLVAVLTAFFGFVLIARAALLREVVDGSTTVSRIKVGALIVTVAAVLVVGVVFGGAIVEALTTVSQLTPR